MNAPSKSRSEPTKPGDIMTDSPQAAPKTPATDMQAEDAGTGDSGGTDEGNEAQAAMKQTSKAPGEPGSRG